jgi:flagellar biosynthesis protein FlhB
MFSFIVILFIIVAYLFLGFVFGELIKIRSFIFPPKDIDEDEKEIIFLLNVVYGVFLIVYPVTVLIFVVCLLGKIFGAISKRIFKRKQK